MRAARHRATVVVIAFGLVALAGACGDDGAAAPATDGTTTDAAATTAPGATTRVVDTENGEVEVPVDPQRVVALDEYAALNLLALGVEPLLVFGAFQSDIGGRVLRDAGIDVEPATAEAGPNVEAIAAAEPDLIVFTTEGALSANVDQLQAVAPSVSLPYTAPWRDVISTTAEVVGRQARAEELIAVLDDRISELRSEVGSDPRSISILADSFGLLFAVAMESPLSQVVDEAGFSRPAAQVNGVADATYDSAIMISQEVLADHAADEMVVLSGAYYDASTLLDSPTFQALPAVVAGRSVVVDGDMWFGTHPFAIWWLLDDLTAIHAGEGQAAMGTPDQYESRWAAFEAATS